MKIGILETGDLPADLRERHGGYPSMFAALLGAVDPGLEFATVRVIDGDIPAAPGQADAWLITGSRHGVYDDLPWIAPLKAFLRQCLSERVPVVGICFGHQILAEALGGRAVKSDRGWGVGVQEYRRVARPAWMADMPERFAVRAMHQDQVVEAPPGTTVLATSDHCPIAALAYGDPERPDAITVQPHPEFRQEFLRALIDLRAGTVIPDASATEARAGLSRPVDDIAWARAIVTYLRTAVRTRAAA